MGTEHFDAYKKAGMTAYMAIGPFQGQKYLAKFDDGRNVLSAAICAPLEEHKHLVDGPAGSPVMYCHLDTGEIIPAPNFMIDGLKDFFNSGAI